MLQLKTKNSLCIRPLDIAICSIFLTMFQPYLLPDLLQIGLRIFLLLYAVIYLIGHTPLNGFINISLILIIPNLISNVANYISGTLSFPNLLFGIQDELCIYCMYTIFRRCAALNYSQRLVTILLALLKWYVIISIISILMLDKGSEIYFFGSKFFTGYYFVVFTGLYYFKHQTEIKYNICKRLLFIMLSVTLFINLAYINASTCLIMYIYMLFLLFIPKNIRNIMKKPVIVVTCIVGSTAILTVLSQILKNRFVQYFILNILHKDLTMTDRLRYYAKAPQVFLSGNIFFGYGYNSEALKEAIALGSNIQNGFLQKIVSYGIIGAVAFLLFIYIAIKKSNKNVETSDAKWPLFAVLHAFIVAAIVEVSFNSLFLLNLFLIRWLYCETYNGRDV